MMRRVEIVIAFLLIFTTGCSARTPIETPLADTRSVTSQKNEPEIPFSIEVLDESNDGQTLRILAGVRARTQWNSSEVMVRLTTLHEGDLREDRVYALSDWFTQEPGNLTMGLPLTRPGEVYKFALQATASDVTDYQLELLWGDEAKQYKGQLSGALSTVTPVSHASAEPLLIRNVEIRREKPACPNAPCPVVFKISAQLFNDGASPLHKAILGVGFVERKNSAQLDLSGVIPQNEEKVEVPSLNLAPGAERPLKLVFESPVAEREAESISPVVRVLSYE